MGRYGPRYQIDLDRQLARVVVEKAMEIDWAWLADGVKRNNMGLGGMAIEAKAGVRDGKLRLEPSGQEIPLAQPGPDELPRWRRARIRGWATKETTRAALE